MKKSIGLILVIIILGAILFVKFGQKKEPKQESKHMIKISSPAFKEGEYIPKKYTCDGDNISPALTIEGVPEEAKSLVLIVEDPDSPRGTFTHWTVWAIDPGIREITQASLAGRSIQGDTDFGKIGYGGPCPGSGTHRYFFRVLALGISLNLPAAAPRADLDKAISGHIIDQASLMGKYARH